MDKVLKIKEIRQGLLQKEFSAVELIQKFLETIQAKNKAINALLEVTNDFALQIAKEIDKKIAEKEKLPLLVGVPFSVKDAIMVKGFKCTAGSRMLADYQAVYSATAFEKLITQGAVFLGKTNL
ncbi:Asp-tRNA(Asn)/Glu-tRNA(Gln) amidotransferase subunit GatA, partial [Candidatus Gribaldobacteria bacterium]|nr:Asp-tRNA(Asn)/Glu-tRNA(Gln) amidotransferase subunit GatA [Candidatus Gribaldobacteria bacterium]